MNTLYSYLKVIEQKLSAPEDPEVQFLNTDIYKNSSFNLKSLSASIFEKIKDTSYLLKFDFYEDLIYYLLYLGIFFFLFYKNLILNYLTITYCFWNNFIY